MKLKYKKAILLTTMSIMGIGLLTLSVSNDHSKAQDNKGNKNGTVQEAFADADTTGTPSGVVTPTLAVTVTPTSLPVYDIEKNANPQIEKLFKDYYEAKTDRDVEAIKKLLSDSTKAGTQDELQSKTEFIEKYSDISTYTKKGFKDGTYIVYVYYEVKINGINTLAPGLTKFYVITGDDGKLKIFSGDMDPETQAYYDARNKDEDIVALINMTNKKSEKAIKSDEDLQNFWESFNKLTNGDSSKDSSKSDSKK